MNDGNARGHLTSDDLADMATYHDTLARFHLKFGRHNLARINRTASINARAAMPVFLKEEAVEEVDENQLELRV